MYGVNVACCLYMVECVWTLICVAAMHSNAFERVCLLFNIAALQSQIAKGQNFDSDEGLKTAVKHFQARCLSVGQSC